MCCAEKSPFLVRFWWDAIGGNGTSNKGEQMALLNPATLPDTPEFPNRLLFAVGGLIAGLVFGTGLALWLRYRAATLRIAPIPTTL